MNAREEPWPEDERLRRAQDGDESAMRELLAQHLDSLRAYVRIQIPQELREIEAVSDVVQSVCRVVLKNSRFEYRGDAQFKCWLYRAVTLRIRSKLRDAHAQRRDRRRVEAGVDPDLLSHYSWAVTPSEVLAMQEEAARIEKAFDELSEQDSELLALRFIADVPLDEIARHLGIGGDAARKRIHRARVRLAHLLDRSA
jgi:RNA polymerase sigma-70 factor (ECF subfamily)